MDLTKEMEAYWTEASEEEKMVLTGIMKGLKRKRETTYSTYISSLMDMQLRKLNENAVEITIPVTPFLNNTIGIVHGGLTATLMDTAMGTAANLSLPENAAAVTSEMKINYTSPGTGKYLRCVAQVLHHGKNVIVTEAKVYGDQEQLISISTGTFFIIKK
ncbi:PaaI family thioesterase [Fictibacillus fluitans]|uniref:Medium/long-chain acyl-CoA thioesterase YigI n=1 Tax=Fictibacillus fluitans TaxID=3058422 RepID=A0ABT8HTF3_9BACL|nr:PaaI family thioesterase [Fictibacillus sp. NE201]MDN4523547.1 PaaI family thioesterase [Fictibacillus sp. NE201]